MGCPHGFRPDCNYKAENILYKCHFYLVSQLLLQLWETYENETFSIFMKSQAKNYELRNINK